MKYEQQKKSAIDHELFPQLCHKPDETMSG